jgi:hypothetical protein
MPWLKPFLVTSIFVRVKEGDVTWSSQGNGVHSLQSRNSLTLLGCQFQHLLRMEAPFYLLCCLADSGFQAEMGLEASCLHPEPQILCCKEQLHPVVTPLAVITLHHKSPGYFHCWVDVSITRRSGKRDAKGEALVLRGLSWLSWLQKLLLQRLLPFFLVSS